MTDDEQIRHYAEGIRDYSDAGVRMYARPLADLILSDRAPVRYALVDADIGDRKRIAAYLPDNYAVVGSTRTVGDRAQHLIAGRDSHGWTLDDYVIPRLASGLYYATEMI